MKQKRYGLTEIIISLISVILILVIATFGFALISQVKKSMKTMIDARMLDVSNTAAAMIDGDILGSLTEDDVASVKYNKIVDTLTVFAENISLSYIYALKDAGDGRFIFTVDPDSEDPAAFGEETVYTKALYAASLGTPSVETDPVKDRRGVFYSSYSPVFDSSGDVAGIIGVDFDAGWYKDQIRGKVFSILLLGILSLLGGIFIVYLFTRRISKHFFRLNEEISVLSRDVGKLTEEIATSPDYADSQEGQQEKETLKNNDVTVDSIGTLSEKIRFIQEEIREYVAYVHQKAYTDSLTDVNNQSAYLQTIKGFNQKIAEQTVSFAVAVFDINGLKEVNDNFGHEEGDRMIRNCAAILKKALGAKNVYRTGGDEFVAILQNTTEEDMKTLFSAVNREVISFNIARQSLLAPVSFSKGYALFDPENDSEFRQVFKRADNAMYRDKSAHYRKYGDRRSYRDSGMN